MSEDLIKEKFSDDKSKAAGHHLFKNKYLISDVIRLSSSSCRKCKQMITQRISVGNKVLPELFCASCKKKHESVFDRINKSLESVD